MVGVFPCNPAFSAAYGCMCVCVCHFASRSCGRGSLSGELQALLVANVFV